MQGPFGFPDSALLGRLSHSGGRRVRMLRPYFYEIDAVGVAPAAANPTNTIVLIEGARPFLWMATTWYAYAGANANTNNTQPIPDVSVALTMGAEALSQAPIALTALGGAPMAESKRLVEPFWLPGTTTIKASFYNNEAGTGDTYTIRLVLIGICGEEA